MPTDARLVIAGGSSFSDEYVADLERLAAEDDRVLLTGYLYGEDLAALYQHAGVFVLPSALEGLPLTLLEAASHGVPIVASDIPPHREVLAADGPGRRLVPVGDDGALAAAVGELLDEGNALAQRAGASQMAASVLARYDWEAATRALEAVYGRVLARTPPAATPPYRPVEPLARWPRQRPDDRPSRPSPELAPRQSVAGDRRAGTSAEPLVADPRNAEASGPRRAAPALALGARRPGSRGP